MLSEKSGAYKVSAATGTQKLAEFVMNYCTTKYVLRRDSYLHRHAFTHLLLYMPKDYEQKAVAYLEHMYEADRNIAAAFIAEALCEGGQAAVNAYFSENNPARLGKEITDIIVRRRDIEVLQMIIDCYAKQEEKTQALALQLQLAELKAAQDLPTGTKVLYGEGNTAVKQQYEQSPSEKMHDKVELLHNDLGHIARKQGMTQGLQEAVVWYKDILERAKQSHAEKPCNESRRRLARAYINLAQIAQERNMDAGVQNAIQWCTEAVKLATQNYEEKPHYESSYDLENACEGLASAMKASGTAEGLQQARLLYEQACTFAEKNYEENPCYDTRRKLINVYANLGYIARALGGEHNLHDAFEWYKKAALLAEENFAYNRGSATHRDLLKICGELGDIAEATQTPEGIEEARLWQTRAAQLEEYPFVEQEKRTNHNNIDAWYDNLDYVAKEEITVQGGMQDWHEPAGIADAVQVNEEEST